MIYYFSAIKKAKEEFEFIVCFFRIRGGLINCMLETGYLKLMSSLELKPLIKSSIKVVSLSIIEHQLCKGLA